MVGREGGVGLSFCFCWLLSVVGVVVFGVLLGCFGGECGLLFFGGFALAV